MKFIKKWIKEKEEIVNKIHKLNEYLSSKEVKEAFDEFEINKMLSLQIIYNGRLF